jgi:large conductance mechanosensitive channel
MGGSKPAMRLQCNRPHFPEGTVVMKIVHEFRQFIQRGNVIDLAVGVIMGTAFTKIVNSLVADIIMPPIGYLIGGVEFTDLKLRLPPLKILNEELAPATVNYGTFIQNSLNFLIIAFCVFLIVKGMNVLSKKPDPAPPPLTVSEKLLTEIRDMLKQQEGLQKQTPAP